MSVRAGSVLPGDPLEEPSRSEATAHEWTWRHWTAVTAAVVAFVLAIQLATAVQGLPGPLQGLIHDFARPPGARDVKVAGTVLALVCMPRRWRLPFAGAILALEIAFNVPRVLAGVPVHYGNGVMWALLGLVAYASLRATGRDRAVGLKAAGIAAIMIVSNYVAGAYLELTKHALPQVADQFVETADRALGNPSWVVGRFIGQHLTLGGIIGDVYTYLSVGAACVALWQLRRSSIDGFPRHHIVRSFIAIGAIGPLIYFLVPVVGPAYAFGHILPGVGWMDVWPHTVPTSLDPVMAGFSTSVPRNCMPSLHTAWATAILLHALRGPRLLQAFGVFWWVCTLAATLAFGYHYGVDLVAGFVFAVTVEAALVRPEAGWHRRRITTVAAGAATFAAILLAIRFLSVPMAHSGPFVAFVLLGAAGAVAWAYVRIARAPSD